MFLNIERKEKELECEVESSFSVSGVGRLLLHTRNSLSKFASQITAQKSPFSILNKYLYILG